MTEPTPLETLAAAVQEFASSLDESDGPVHVVTSLVVWEELQVDDDHEIKYASTGGVALSGALGLADASRVLLQRDVLSDD